jgi:hypothetical protein
MATVRRFQVTLPVKFNTVKPRQMDGCWINLLKPSGNFTYDQV